MFDANVLGTIAQLGIGLAGFSGIVLVLTQKGGEATALEKDRLGIMLGASLGATFLALLPFVFDAFQVDASADRAANALMAVYCVGFLRYYVPTTLRMRKPAPEIVNAGPFGGVIAGHTVNILLQIGGAIGLLPAAPVYLLGLIWLLFHGAYQFKRILFIRPRSSFNTPPADPKVTAGNTESRH